MNLGKLIGNGKTLASGVAAVLVQFIAPMLRDKGVDVPAGLEDGITTILLVFMGVVGLGSRSVRVDEKVDESVIELKKEINDLKNKK